jgi:hypothetical protein
MAHTKTLAPVRTIDWDAISQRVKDEILPALTGGEQFMAFENQREQCFHTCRILRIRRLVLCTVHPDQLERLAIRFLLCFGEIADPDRGNPDVEEEQAHLEECARILYDLKPADDEDTFQTH